MMVLLLRGCAATAGGNEGGTTEAGLPSLDWDGSLFWLNTTCPRRMPRGPFKFVWGC